jgi:hypothetical protein
MHGAMVAKFVSDLKIEDLILIDEYKLLIFCYKENRPVSELIGRSVLALG